MTLAVLLAALLLIPSLAWAGGCSLVEPPVWMRAKVGHVFSEPGVIVAVPEGARGRLCQPQVLDGGLHFTVAWETVKAYFTRAPEFSGITEWVENRARGEHVRMELPLEREP